MTIMNVVLFHRDLRLRDHLPLSAAIRTGTVMPLYVVEPSFWTGNCSIRHYQFVLESLTQLKEQVEERGGTFFFFIGDLEEAFQVLLETYGVFRVFTYHERERHGRIVQWMNKHGLPLTTFSKEGSVEAELSDRRYREKWNEYMEEEQASVPEMFPSINEWPSSFHTDLDECHSLKVPGEKIRFGLEGGELNALDTLATFLQKGGEKPSTMMEAIRFTSQLSPYITWGNISIRHIVQALREKKEIAFNSVIDSLLLRCKIARNSVVSEEKVTDHSLLPTITGIPILDAMMNYVKKTGWIDHRSREAIVSMHRAIGMDKSSINRELARLWLDYDPIIHSFYINSCKKSIHPVSFSKKVDPKGTFIRRNVPQLKDVSEKYIHEPWLYPGFFQLDYPAPIIDIYRVYASPKRQSQVNEDQLTLDLK